MKMKEVNLVVVADTKKEIAMRTRNKLGLLISLMESKGYKCHYFVNMLSDRNKAELVKEPCEINSIILINKKYRMLVSTEQVSGNCYNFNFYMCPDKAFDRWANSRHIKFKIPSDWVGQKEFYTLFEKRYVKAKWLADNLNISYFNEGITIEL